jgi:hypothetical protein
LPKTPFLEVVSPTRESTTAGRLLERRGGDGGYMVILQTDQLAADRKRFAALGVREVWSIELEDIAAVHLHPKDVGAAIVSFDQPLPPESWRWGGPSWQQHVRADRTLSIVGAELQSDAPQALAARWSQVLDRPVRALSEEAYAIELDVGELTFVRASDGRGEGLCAVTVKLAQGVSLPDVELCGVRFTFAC